jgi:hypothetical protein
MEITHGTKYSSCLTNSKKEHKIDNEQKYNMLVNPTVEDLDNYEQYTFFLNAKKKELDIEIYKHLTIVTEIREKKEYILLVLSLDEQRRRSTTRYKEYRQLYKS